MMNSPKRPIRSSILLQLDYANVLTLFGLLLSFLSTIAAIHAQFYFALIGLMAAGVVDLMDGAVARRISRTLLQAEVGGQLDGLVDLCAFGFSPTIFVYCLGLQSLVGCLILMIYLGAAGLRTAYFGCVGLSGSEQAPFYQGLPVAYVAVFLPLGYLAHFVGSSDVVIPLVAIIFLCHAIAMLLPIHVPKPQGIWRILLILGSVVLSGVYGWAIATGR